MSQFEKLRERVLNVPKDLTYEEIKKFLAHFGFEEQNKGKTSGSRIMYYRNSDQAAILLHKPHPGNIMKKYAIEQVIRVLQDRGDL